jgi:hypothetical protein
MARCYLPFSHPIAGTKDKCIAWRLAAAEMKQKTERKPKRDK